MHVLSTYLIMVTAIDSASGRLTVSRCGTRAMFPLDFAKSIDLIYCIQIEGTFHDAIEKNVKIMKEVEIKLFE